MIEEQTKTAEAPDTEATAQAPQQKSQSIQEEIEKRVSELDPISYLGLSKKQLMKQQERNADTLNQLSVTLQVLNERTQKQAMAIEVMNQEMYELKREKFELQQALIQSELNAGKLSNELSDIKTTFKTWLRACPLFQQRTP
ncbi:MAG: hypothetical protein HUU10_04340 [Bacteroidetes bacterium]|nr:hypothetical protein [Bacteroidota bacterium]